MTFPIAIDYRLPVAHYRNAEPLPPVPEGWARLLASEYSEGDEWEETGELAPLNDTDVIPVRRQTASGVCKEYQRRADEWAANRPANVRTYTQAEYDAATQAALDAHAQAHDFWNMAEAGQFSYPGNAFQAEAASLVAWAAQVWQARYAHTDSTVEPAAMVAAILAQHPAP